MIKSLYGKYFQKSKSFLYPALGIKKTSKYFPINTYLSIEGYIGPEDIKLICLFNKKESKDFLDFETAFLIENPLFSEKIETDSHYIYVFDFSIYQNDWFSFLLGRYSKLSSVLKKAIKTYYGESSSEYQYMDTYLYPEEYYVEYSNLLDVDVDFLKNIGELCNSCDIEKETLKIPKEYLERIQKTT